MTTEKSVKKLQKLIGRVISHRSAKSAIVEVVHLKKHPKYHKRYTETKRYMVHDENDAYQVGDMVEIVPSRPYSKRKRFLIVGKIKAK